MTISVAVITDGYGATLKLNIMYNHKQKQYRISPNRTTKTYTIRIYENGKQIAKYRSLPQGKSFQEQWTEDDIKYYLSHSNDYFEVKSKRVS